MVWGMVGVIFRLPLTLLSLFLFRKYFFSRLYLLQTLPLPEHEQDPKAVLLTTIEGFEVA